MTRGENMPLCRLRGLAESLLTALLAALAISTALPLHAQEPVAMTPSGEVFALKLPAGAGTAEPAATEANGTVQFIGTATVLIRYQGFTILTDPNFLHKGDHVHLGYGITSERLTNPAIDLDKLPPVDVVVLSHMHEDHFDKLVQEKLARNTPIVTTKEASERLKKLGFTRSYGLGKWDQLEVEKGEGRLRITAVPGRHGKAGMQILLPSVMGSVQLLQIIRPQHAIPIHYNDYDVFKSPLADFAKEVKAAGLEQQVSYLAHGETYSFTPRKR
jgi:L-ascorbate metabolism protein UlaG (beta-lactamase superfamily)